MHLPKRTPHPHLPLSSAIASRLEWLPSAGSTNDVLVQAATGPSGVEWPDLAVVATDHQTAGRGRLGRTWSAPAGGSLAISVLLRPTGADGEPIPVERWGVLPLLAGIAMSQVIGGLAHRSSDPVMLKWPNDVLIGSRKVSGILGELLPGGAGLVIGAGVNLTLTEEQLPVPTATSLLLAGVQQIDPDAVLAGYLHDLGVLYDRWQAHGGDAVASGVIDDAVRVSATLGRAVRVELPDGAVRRGVARSLDDSGRLVVELPDGASPLVVSAGDVTHLRHDDS
ncbi:biotin--[acetyl-CoA-carboxylase] ligase [Herbiconiux sp. P15]|uniref:biotin--[acetyl-CoA-carboxylase] ligase n=1 Tax=Herbiconiux liukaitaii TaxID=3342799 RepID=UPI0035BABA7B